MKKDNMRVIATVMGEPDSVTRNNEVSGMLDFAFAQYGLNTVLTHNSVVKNIKISKSKFDKVEIVPIKDVNILYKKVDGETSPTYDIKLENIKMPIKKGSVVGKLYIKNNDKVINTIDLTVKNNIEKCSFIELYIKNIKSIISGNINFS